MTWIQAATLVRDYPIEPVRLEGRFSSSVLIVQADSVAKSPTWRRAGWLIPELEIPNQPEINPAHAYWRRIYFGTSRVELRTGGLPYSLSFKGFRWIYNINLVIWHPEAGSDPPPNPVILNNIVSVSRHPDYSDLWITVFEEAVEYAAYEVISFRDLRSGRFVSRPATEPQPYLLRCTFTQNVPIEAGAIVASLKV